MTKTTELRKLSNDDLMARFKAEGYVGEMTDERGARIDALANEITRRANRGELDPFAPKYTK